MPPPLSRLLRLVPNSAPLLGPFGNVRTGFTRIYQSLTLFPYRGIHDNVLRASPLTKVRHTIFPLPFFPMGLCRKSEQEEEGIEHLSWAVGTLCCTRAHPVPSPLRKKRLLLPPLPTLTAHPSPHASLPSRKKYPSFPPPPPLRKSFPAEE